MVTTGLSLQVQVHAPAALGGLGQSAGCIRHRPTKLLGFLDLSFMSFRLLLITFYQNLFQFENTLFTVRDVSLNVSQDLAFVCVRSHLASKRQHFITQVAQGILAQSLPVVNRRVTKATQR